MMMKMSNNVSVLDDDNSGDIDYRELITGLEYFKDNSFEEKLKGIIIFFGKERDD